LEKRKDEGRRRNPANPIPQQVPAQTALETQPKSRARPNLPGPAKPSNPEVGPAHLFFLFPHRPKCRSPAAHLLLLTSPAHSALRPVSPRSARFASSQPRARSLGLTHGPHPSASPAPRVRTRPRPAQCLSRQPRMSAHPTTTPRASPPSSL
jgi:hypothetical protein